MGTINKGILGGFSGKVGTVVGGSWKGIEYMRSKSNKRVFQPSQKQIEQQLRFALTMYFLQPLSALLEITFASFAVKMTGMNSAFSYFINNAISGTYPDFVIDYSLALVSRGDLPNALSPTVTLKKGGVLTFNWTDNSGSGSASAADQAVLVVYCPAVRQAVYTTKGGDRSSETGDLLVSQFTGQQVETYLAFISASGKTATSIFTGEVMVS